MRLIEIPEDGVVRILMNEGNATIGEYRVNLSSFPTVDAVPVVRCKDCDWRKKNTFCLKHMHYVKDDYFCATGARMDGEEDV